MSSTKQPEAGLTKSPAAEHVSNAYDLLISLQERVGKHPELAEAIEKLESALSILTVQTGGLI